jgi:uncharacterized protein (DUF433 family)
MRKLTPRSYEQDIRDYPVYTVPEAARYVGMSRRTLYSWLSDNPLWDTAGADYSVRLLSFKDLAQSHFIEFIRHHAKISAKKSREILKYAKLETNSPYPLLEANIKVLLGHILLDKPARNRIPRHVVDLSHHRQLMIGEVVDLYATRIKRNTKGELERLYPWRFWNREENARKPVTIDPNIMSGSLVVTGTRIPVDVLLNRKRAGESVPELAKDYGLTEEAVNDALRHLALRKAA